MAIHYYCCRPFNKVNMSKLSFTIHDLKGNTCQMAKSKSVCVDCFDHKKTGP